MKRYLRKALFAAALLALAMQVILFADAGSFRIRYNPGDIPKWAFQPGAGGGAPLPPEALQLQAQGGGKAPQGPAAAAELLAPFRTGPNPFDSMPSSKHQGGSGVLIIGDALSLVEQQKQGGKISAAPSPAPLASKIKLDDLRKKAAQEIDDDGQPFVDGHKQAGDKDFNKVAQPKEPDLKELPPGSQVSNRRPSQQEIFDPRNTAKIKQILAESSGLDPRNPADNLKVVNRIRGEVFGLTPFEADPNLERLAGSWSPQSGGKHYDDYGLWDLGRQFGFINKGGGAFATEQITTASTFGPGREGAGGALYERGEPIPNAFAGAFNAWYASARQGYPGHLGPLVNVITPDKHLNYYNRFGGVISPYPTWFFGLTPQNTLAQR